MNWPLSFGKFFFLEINKFVCVFVFTAVMQTLHTHTNWLTSIVDSLSILTLAARLQCKHAHALVTLLTWWSIFRNSSLNGFVGLVRETPPHNVHDDGLLHLIAHTHTNERDWLCVCVCLYSQRPHTTNARPEEFIDRRALVAIDRRHRSKGNFWPS